MCGAECGACDPEAAKSRPHTLNDPRSPLGASARRDIREAYRCDCNGETWPPGRTLRSPIARSAAHGLAVVRSVCGTAPRTCPWAAFREPRVQEVMRAYRWAEKGQAREAWGDSPPAWLKRGVEVFGSALEAAKADVLDTERKA